MHFMKVVLVCSEVTTSAAFHYISEFLFAREAPFLEEISSFVTFLRKLRPFDRPKMQFPMNSTVFLKEVMSFSCKICSEVMK